MRLIGLTSALALSLLPSRSPACEVAVKDAKAAIAEVRALFEPYRARCRYDDEGIQCLVKERSLSTSSVAMRGFVPGYLAVLSASAGEKVDKESLSRIFVSHMVDRSPTREIKTRFVRALETGEEFKVSGEDCTLAVRMKDGMLEVVLAGPMVR